MKISAILLIALAFFTGENHATEVSANTALATDYVYRGISQTDEEFTIQGGFDVSFESGFYAGIWASNVAFDGSIETDYYLGYRTEINKFEIDIGYLVYVYPNQPTNQPTNQAGRKILILKNFISVYLSQISHLA